ncbi:MAG: hypothetical protein ACREMQ_02035 [Longimicrobiales bacterium]
MDRFWIACSLCLLVAGCRSDGESEASGDDAPATVLANASAGDSESVCQVAKTDMPLPEEVRESSGLAQSRSDASLFWTHNDAGNDAEIFGVDAEGRLVQRVRIANAQAEDWEDIESGMCETGACLYIADIGDNNGKRDGITIYRVPEPEKGATESAPAVALNARYPDGAQDAESLFALPSGDLYVVTKGQHGPIALYRYPAPQRPGETVTLERVRELFPKPNKDGDRATGATASPDGQWVGVRSHDHLYLYRAGELLGAGRAAQPTVVDLKPLKQPQGEAVVIADDGTVWLSTEAASKREGPSWARLQCTHPGS